MKYASGDLMDKIRVCFIIPGLGDGGAQKQCIYLLNALQKRLDIELHYIYMHPGVNDNLLVNYRLNAVRLKVVSNYDPTNIVQLLNLLRAVKPDILLSWLHACDIYSFFARLSLPAMHWIMTERDSFYPSDVRYWMRRRLGVYADAIIANSVKGSDYWRAAGARCPTYVVPNIVNKPIGGDATREPVALFVGRLEPQKNVETVVRAFCKVALRRRDLAFKIVGEGSLREKLQSIVRSEGVSDRVTFLGFRPNAPELMARAKVVVSLSHHEGLPNALLEGVAAGATIVASDIPEHRELFGDTYPLYVTERTDPAVSSIMIEHAFEAANTEGIYKVALSRVNEMTPDAVGRQYMEIFQNITRNRR